MRIHTSLQKNKEIVYVVSFSCMNPVLSCSAFSPVPLFLCPALSTILAFTHTHHLSIWSKHRQGTADVQSLSRVCVLYDRLLVVLLLLLVEHEHARALGCCLGQLLRFFAGNAVNNLSILCREGEKQHTYISYDICKCNKQPKHIGATT